MIIIFIQGKYKCKIMLSDRFYSAISFILPIMNILGIFLPTWDNQIELFNFPSKFSKSYQLYRKRQRFNEILMQVWCLFACVQLVRFHIVGNYMDFNFVFSFISTGLISVEAWTICSHFPEDCCVTINGIILQLRRIRRKQYIF